MEAAAGGPSAADIDPMHPHPHLYAVHHLQPDFAAHLQQTPHIPLPLETHLPPSSFDFTSHGAFPFQQAQQMHGSAGHPLFEGVMAMHQMLGHDLGMSWTDMSACDQSSAMSYAQSSAHHYAYDPTPQWPSSPTSIIESTPSPLDESLPLTPEQLIDYAPEPLISSSALPHEEEEPPPPSHPLSHHHHSAPCGTFPLVVTSTNTYEHTVAFQADRQKSEKASSKLDPHAADFIREKLGELRWSLFSSRLAERRTTTQKPKQSAKTDSAANGGSSLDSFPADKSGGATVIDFLVKVEVVKSVLRSYVPHPYNPLKTLSHSYTPAPSGQVTLSRSTVLALSGWSNTQFSYWARRAEAISVLASHDERLRTAATALERRLRNTGLVAYSTADNDVHHHSSSASSSTSHSATSRPPSSDPASPDFDPEEWVRLYITGKGLDVIIDDVKKRTGVSPFLRGKHSSLDPFGTATAAEGGGPGSRVAVYMPTFQAEKYVHEIIPPESSPQSEGSETRPASTKKSGKRKVMSPEPTPVSESEESSVASSSSPPTWPDGWTAEDLARFTAPMTTQTPSSSSTPPPYTPEDPSAEFDTSPVNLIFHDYAQPAFAPFPSAASMNPSPRPKKRRLAPAPSSATSSNSLGYASDYATNALRMYSNHPLGS
ncbi:hypothetical protein BDW22DRAFT_1429712 [Trametopsis cervina]|nr:hypothetical protein BDW22DRAFT_1429712 [Trametopsis cervina]